MIDTTTQMAYGSGSLSNFLDKLAYLGSDSIAETTSLLVMVYEVTITLGTT
jgi:hypothetical protein